MKKVTTALKKGFTLIELLVVIAIIGLLSSIVLASLSSARQKAKNAAYLTELKQLITALKLYREDNGDYPDFSADGKVNNSSGSWPVALDTALVDGGYIPSLPIHPDNGGVNSIHTYIIFNDQYSFGADATAGFACAPYSSTKFSTVSDLSGIDGIIAFSDLSSDVQNNFCLGENNPGGDYCVPYTYSTECFNF